MPPEVYRYSFEYPFNVKKKRKWKQPSLSGDQIYREMGWLQRADSGHTSSQQDEIGSIYKPVRLLHSHLCYSLKAEKPTWKDTKLQANWRIIVPRTTWGSLNRLWENLRPWMRRVDVMNRKRQLKLDEGRNNGIDAFCLNGTTGLSLNESE